MSGSGQLKGCQVVGRLATLAILISQAQRLLEPLQRLAQKSARRPPGRAQDSLQASHQKRRLDTLPAYPALAVRTMLGQLALIGLVEMRRAAAMSPLAAPGRPWLTSRLTGMGPGRPLRKRRRLRLSRTLTGSQCGRQSSPFRLELLNPTILRRVLFFQAFPLASADCARVLEPRAALRNKRGHYVRQFILRVDTSDSIPSR